MAKTYAALMTAFDENGFVDEKGTREIIRNAIDDMHVDGLFVGGSIGENFLLGTPAKKNIFQIVWDEAKNDDVDLIAQIGSSNFHEAKDLATYVTSDLGYKTIAAITPFYYHFTFAEIDNYYNQLLKDLDTKMLLYITPGMTHTDLTLNQYEELLSNPKIIGVDYVGNDIYYLEQLIDTFPNKLVYIGNSKILLPSLSIGIDGYIGGLANIKGTEISREIDLSKKQKWSEATHLQTNLNQLVADMEQNGIYQVMKLILQKMGVHAGYNRIPLGKPTDIQIKQSNAIYKKYFA